MRAPQLCLRGWARHARLRTAAAPAGCVLLGATAVAGSAPRPVAATGPAGASPVGPGATGSGTPDAARDAGLGLAAACQARYGLPCYSPRQLERAYGLPALYARGLDGRGRTIVIVDPFGSPTIRHDLRVFDRGCGLPDLPSLRVRQPVGAVPRFHRDDPDMVAAASEATTDVEAAHQAAPGANILLVETPVAETLTGGGFAQLMAAVNYVVTHDLGDVISQSFGIPEQNFPDPGAIGRLRYAFRSAYAHHVTVVAATNDFGAAGPARAGGGWRTRPVVDWPASDPLVTAVGGTQLRLTSTGRRTAPDTAWNESGSAAVARYAGPLPWAGSGGTSAIFSRPGYQDPVRAVTGNRRGIPDVALGAAFHGADLTYESFTGGAGSWRPAGGTSVAAPEFAGLVAIADQYARTRLGLVNPALYRLEQARAPGLLDITEGSNTVRVVDDGSTVTVPGYSARPGYDLVTGTGTIDAAHLVPELRAARTAPARSRPAPAAARPATWDRG